MFPNWNFTLAPRIYFLKNLSLLLWGRLYSALTLSLSTTWKMNMKQPCGEAILIKTASKKGAGKANLECAEDGEEPGKPRGVLVDSKQSKHPCQPQHRKQNNSRTKQRPLHRLPKSLHIVIVKPSAYLKRSKFTDTFELFLSACLLLACSTLTRAITRNTELIWK